MCNAVEGLVRRHENNVAVIAGLTDPLTVLIQVLGAENFVVSMMLDPDAVDRWLKALCPLVC